MTVLIVDCGSSKVSDIEKMIRECNHACERVSLSILPSVNLSKYSGIIISGAPILLTKSKPEEYSIKIRNVIQSGKPLLGICFGHQLIGLNFNSEISLCHEDREMRELTVIRETPIVTGLGKSFTMKEDHTEKISLPDGFFIVAGSEICANEIMQHESKMIFGIQSHPEVSGENGKIFFSNFLNLCKD